MGIHVLKLTKKPPCTGLPQDEYPPPPPLPPLPPLPPHLPPPNAGYPVPPTRGPAAAGARKVSKERPKEPKVYRTATMQLVYLLTHDKPLLTRAYRIFGLRRGTMMIAIHDLLWTSFLVMVLVLATTHSHEAFRLVESSIQDQEQQEQAHLAGLAHGGPTGEPAEAGEGEDRRNYYVRLLEATYLQVKGILCLENEIKLHNGMHLATVMTMIMVLGISAAGIDMITSMMLLAGAILVRYSAPQSDIFPAISFSISNVRQLMMPWLSLRLMEMLVLTVFVTVSLCYQFQNTFFLKMLVLFGLMLLVMFYHWLVAYSLHEHLCRMERTGLITHHVRGAGGRAHGRTHGRKVDAFDRRTAGLERTISAMERDYAAFNRDMTRAEAQADAHSARTKELISRTKFELERAVERLTALPPCTCSRPTTAGEIDVISVGAMGKPVFPDDGNVMLAVPVMGEVPDGVRVIVGDIPVAPDPETANNKKQAFPLV